MNNKLHLITSKNVRSLSKEIKILIETCKKWKEIKYIISSHIRNKNTNVDADTLLKLIKKSKITQEEYKKEINISFLKTLDNPSSQEAAENLKTIASKVYPNDEISRLNLYKTAIDSKFINNDNIKYLDLHLMGRGEYSDAIDKSLFELLECALIKAINILEIVAGRIPAIYPSLGKIFLDKETNQQMSLKECLTEFGLEEIKSESGNNLTIKGKKEIKPIDLFSFLDIAGKLVGFSNILKPEIKNKIAEEFVPSDKILLIQQKEVDKLKLLTGNQSNIENRFLSNKTLCEYINNKVNIPPIDNNTNYKLSYLPSHLSEQEQKEHNDLFKKIIANPNQEDVIKFFENYGISFSDVNNENKNVFLKFVGDNAKELTYALTTNTQLGKDFFRLLATTLPDGCSKNISSHFNLALYGSIIQEPKDRILYSVIINHIIRPILNRGNDVIDNHDNPFTNPNVVDYLLSPDAFFRKIAESFYNPETKKQGTYKSWDFIRDVLGKELSDIIGNNIDYHDEKYSELAAYLVLKNTIGTGKLNENIIKENKNIIEKAYEAMTKSPANSNISNPQYEQIKEEKEEIIKE